MKLSELMGCAVVGADGTELGEVSDVRLAQDGPLIGGFTASLRVEAVLIGRSGLAERLGYVHGGMTKPALLAWVLRRFTGRLRLVDWTDVDRWDIEERRVRLAATASPRSL